MAELAGVDSPKRLVALDKMPGVPGSRTASAAEAAFAPVIETDDVSRSEYCGVRQDGSRFPVEISGSLLKDPQGNPKGVITTVRDITERRQAEDALRKSEEKFSLLFHASPAPISVSRLEDGYIVDCNESLSQLFGMSREELVGSTTLERWADPRDRQHLLEQLKAANSVRDMQCRLRHKDGRILITRLSAEIVELEGEKCILALFVDITERHRAEEEIQKLALVVRHTSDLVSLTDLKGRMIVLNEAGSNLLGISAE